MKKYIPRAAAVLLGLCLLTGCAAQPPTVSTAAPTDATGEAISSPGVSQLLEVQTLFSDRDRDASFEESTAAVITLQGSSAVCDSNAVRVDGSTVTVTDEGTYILRGTLEGSILVDAGKEDKTHLVLDGVSIHGSSTALYIRQADKVFITLAEGSENTLSSDGSFTPDGGTNLDAALFSKEDLTLNGSGMLTVTSPGGHGIVCKDALVLTGGSYAVTAASHAIAAKDSLSISGGTYSLTAGKDGLHAENADDPALGSLYIADGSFTVSAEGDGISAAAHLQMDGGTYTIVTGGSENGVQHTSDNWGNFMGGPGGMKPGGQTFPNAAEDTAEDSNSSKALKAGSSLAVNGGSFTIDSADDAVHANGSITVSGGTFSIATGDDGFHADDTLTVQGGDIHISESYEGMEGLHIVVSAGQIKLVASDDGLNAAGGTDQSGFGGLRGDDVFGGKGGRPGGTGGMGNPGGMGGSSDGSIVISGGQLDITASGDGIDANGYLQITGGFTTVCGPTQGDTATLDYDTTAEISGGTFIGTGASGMAQTFSQSPQGVIAVNVGSQSAGTQILLTDSQGRTVLTHCPGLSFGVVILSSPDIVKGAPYTITVGGASGTFDAI